MRRQHLSIFSLILLLPIAGCASITVSQRNEDSFIQNLVQDEKIAGKRHIAISHSIAGSSISLRVTKQDMCNRKKIHQVDRVEVTERTASGWMVGKYIMGGSFAALGGLLVGWSTMLPDSPQKDIVTEESQIGSTPVAVSGYISLGLGAGLLAWAVIDSVRALDKEEHMGKVDLVQSKSVVACGDLRPVKGNRVKLDLGGGVSLEELTNELGEVNLRIPESLALSPSSTPTQARVWVGKQKAGEPMDVSAAISAKTMEAFKQYKCVNSCAKKIANRFEVCFRPWMNFERFDVDWRECHDKIDNRLLRDGKPTVSGCMKQCSSQAANRACSTNPKMLGRLLTITPKLPELAKELGKEWKKFSAAATSINRSQGMLGESNSQDADMALVQSMLNYGLKMSQKAEAAKPLGRAAWRYYKLGGPAADLACQLCPDNEKICKPLKDTAQKALDILKEMDKQKIYY